MISYHVLHWQSDNDNTNPSTKYNVINHYKIIIIHAVTVTATTDNNYYA